MLYKHVHSSFLFTIIIVIKHNRKQKSILCFSTATKKNQLQSFKEKRLEEEQVMAQANKCYVC